MNYQLSLICSLIYICLMSGIKVGVSILFVDLTIRLKIIALICSIVYICLMSGIKVGMSMMFVDLTICLDIIANNDIIKLINIWKNNFQYITILW